MFNAFAVPPAFAGLFCLLAAYIARRLNNPEVARRMQDRADYFDAWVDYLDGGRPHPKCMLRWRDPRQLLLPF